MNTCRSVDSKGTYGNIPRWTERPCLHLGKSRRAPRTPPCATGLPGQNEKCGNLVAACWGFTWMCPGVIIAKFGFGSRKKQEPASESGRYKGGFCNCQLRTARNGCPTFISRFLDVAAFVPGRHVLSRDRGTAPRKIARPSSWRRTQTDRRPRIWRPGERCRQWPRS